MNINNKSGLVVDAQQIASANCDARPDEQNISLIVIHNISLPPGEFGGPYISQLFTNQLNPNAHPYFADIHQLKVSSHLLIRRTGEIIQYVPLHKRAWHAGTSSYCGAENCNDFSIGIELEGSDDIPFEEIQYTALAKCILNLQQNYPSLPKDAITGHSNIAPGRKTDPGPAFNWDHLQQLLTTHMALICILFGIIFERFSEILEKYRNFSWFDNYTRWLLKTLPGIGSQNQSSIIILLLPIMLVVAGLQVWFDDRLLGLIAVIFGAVIFAFCLGPKDLSRQIDRYLEARESGDEEAANIEARAIMQAEPPADPDQQILEVMRGILHESNDRFFAVIFWFVLLGPFGALLYRLTSHTMRSSGNATLANAARQFQAMLAWAPAHVVAMGFALTGNYEGAKQEFYGKNKQNDLSDCNYHTLITAGQGALKDCAPGEETACIRSARGLVLRTLIVWLAFISILTLMGWMS